LDLERLYGHAHQLSICAAEDEIQQNCRAIASAYGCEYFFLKLYLPIAERYVTLFDTPHGWIDKYEKNEYLKADPTVTHCRSQVTPLYWNEIDYSGDLDPDAAKNVMAEAALHDMKHGMSLPMHGPGTEWGIFSLSSAKPLQRESDFSGLDLDLLVSAVHWAIKRVNGEYLTEPRRGGELTTREIECLEWIARGKTAWEVARILHLSEYTVTFHTRNAIAKLGTNNRSHAVAKAISKALINFS